MTRIVRSSALPLVLLLAVTLAASREEVDVDQTAVAHWNTVVDTSKFNTARLVWTQDGGRWGNGSRHTPWFPWP